MEIGNLLFLCNQTLSRERERRRKNHQEPAQQRWHAFQGYSISMLHAQVWIF